MKQLHHHQQRCPSLDNTVLIQNLEYVLLKYFWTTAVFEFKIMDYYSFDVWESDKHFFPADISITSFYGHAIF